MSWFAKVYCFGSSHIILDAREVSFAFTGENVQALCAQGTGLDAGSVVLLMPAEAAPFGARIYHPGSGEAGPGDLYGNIHALAFTLYQHGYTGDESFAIETAAGVRPSSIIIEDNEAAGVVVDWGRFQPRQVGPDRLHVTWDGAPEMSFLVVTGPAAGPGDWDGGPVVAVRSAGGDEPGLTIWDPGTGEPVRSEAAAAAATAAAKQAGLAGSGELVRVNGEFTIEIDDDWSARSVATAFEVCAGHLSAGFVRKLEAGVRVAGRRG